MKEWGKNWKISREQRKERGGHYQCNNNFLGLKVLSFYTEIIYPTPSTWIKIDPQLEQIVVKF